MDRRTFLATTVGVTSATLAGCLDLSGTLSSEDYDIGMSSSAFRPARSTISVGDTVVWGNTSSRAHTVTAYEAALPKNAEYFASGGFESEQAARDAWLNGNGKIIGGQTYKHTFEVPGTYHYFCIPHERVMLGKITVKKN
jgi:plastocyanin